jgi:tetrahydromethanopterin S-methyltransferase subunit B
MNTNLYREIIESKNLHFSAESSGNVVSKYSPSEIRETISKLVAEDNLDMAFALSQAGLALYPDSEDVLAIAGLLAMLKEDWVESAAILNHLIEVQGDRTPVTTHVMFIRALRCALEPAAALSAVMLAHEQYPNHPELEREFKALSEMLGFATAE